jgi:pyridoxal biosynthesis lyase PdxS
MLDKTQALQFAASIVQIVANHVEDQDVLAEISDEIGKALNALSVPKGG